MKVYISLPISGHDIVERRAFAENIERKLLELGHNPANPLRNGLAPDAPYRAHMRRDIYNLCGCDAIYQAPGWQDSQGCIVENAVAKLLELVYFKF